MLLGNPVSVSIWCLGSTRLRTVRFDIASASVTILSIYFYWDFTYLTSAMSLRSWIHHMMRYDRNTYESSAVLKIWERNLFCKKSLLCSKNCFNFLLWKAKDEKHCSVHLIFCSRCSLMRPTRGGDNPIKEIYLKKDTIRLTFFDDALRHSLTRI